MEKITQYKLNTKQNDKTGNFYPVYQSRASNNEPWSEVPAFNFLSKPLQTITLDESFGTIRKDSLSSGIDMALGIQPKYQIPTIKLPFDGPAPQVLQNGKIIKLGAANQSTSVETSGTRKCRSTVGFDTDGDKQTDINVQFESPVSAELVNSHNGSKGQIKLQYQDGESTMDSSFRNRYAQINNKSVQITNISFDPKFGSQGNKNYQPVVIAIGAGEKLPTVKTNTDIPHEQKIISVQVRDDHTFVHAGIDEDKIADVIYIFPNAKTLK